LAVLKGRVFAPYCSSALPRVESVLCVAFAHREARPCTKLSFLRHSCSRPEPDFLPVYGRSCPLSEVLSCRHRRIAVGVGNRTVKRASGGVLVSGSALWRRAPLAELYRARLAESRPLSDGFIPVVHRVQRIRFRLRTRRDVSSKQTSRKLSKRNQEPLVWAMFYREVFGSQIHEVSRWMLWHAFISVLLCFPVR